MAGIVSKRVSTNISYVEASDSEEESSMIVGEVIDEVLRAKQALNKKKQYKKS